MIDKILLDKDAKRINNNRFRQKKFIKYNFPSMNELKKRKVIKKSK